MKNLLILLALSWLPPAVSSGATDDGVSLRFLAESTPENLGDVVLAGDDRLSPPFGLSSEHLSVPIPATARKLTLRMKDKPVVLSEISLPQSGSTFIILLIPDPKSGYRAVVIDATGVNFKGGDVYFYNHADMPVFGYVGPSRFTLKSGVGELLRPAGAKQDTYYDVGFGVREPEGDRVLRMLRWPVASRSRSYVFFYRNPVKNRIDFRAVEEFVAAPEPIHAVP